MGATIYFVPSKRQTKTRGPQDMATRKNEDGKQEKGMWRVQVSYGVAPNKFLRSGYYATKTAADADFTKWRAEWLDIKRARKHGGEIPPEEANLKNTLNETFEKYKKRRESKRKENVQQQGREWTERDVENTRADQAMLSRLQRDFAAFLDLPLVRITKQDVSDWRDRLLKGDPASGIKPVKAATVRRNLNMLQAMFRTARDEWGWWPEDRMLPMTSLRKGIAKGTARTRTLAPGELERLIEAAELAPQGPATTHDQVAMLAFRLACHTAMRAGEIRTLTPQTVHLKARFARLDLTKNNESRIVPLDDMAVLIIKRLMASMPPEASLMVPLSRNALTRAFIRVKRRAKIKNLRFHDSRAEGTKWLAQTYENVMDLSKFTGHKDLKLLMDTYYRSKPVELAKRMIGKGIAAGPVQIVTHEQRLTLPGYGAAPDETRAEPIDGVHSERGEEVAPA